MYGFSQLEMTRSRSDTLTTSSSFRSPGMHGAPESPSKKFQVSTVVRMSMLSHAPGQNASADDQVVPEFKFALGRARRQSYGAQSLGSASGSTVRSNPLVPRMFAHRAMVPGMNGTPPAAGVAHVTIEQRDGIIGPFRDRRDGPRRPQLLNGIEHHAHDGAKAVNVSICSQLEAHLGAAGSIR